MRDVLKSNSGYAQFQPGPFGLHDRVLHIRSILPVCLEVHLEVDPVNIPVSRLSIHQPNPGLHSMYQLLHLDPVSFGNKIPEFPLHCRH